VEFVTLDAGGDSFSQDSPGTPILARPFLNTETNLEDTHLIAFPGLVSGSLSVTPNTDFAIKSLRLRHGISRSACSRVDVLGGFLVTTLDEQLLIHESVRSLSGDSGVPIGTTIALTDSFLTENSFFGPQIGLAGQYHRGRWIVNTAMKLAYGTTRSDVTIAGSTTVTTPDGGTSTSPDGLLALPSNIGQYEAEKFTFVPELGTRVGIRLGTSWCASLGYTLVYWGQVARPGDQVDRNLNLSQTPPDTLVGAPSPEFEFSLADFLAEAFSLGLECTF
jgi:hypothetical protein